MSEYFVTTANSGNTVRVYHDSEACACLVGSESRVISEQEIDNRNLALCGQCERLRGETDEAHDQDHSVYVALREAEK